MKKLFLKTCFSFIQLVLNLLIVGNLPSISKLSTLLLMKFPPVSQNFVLNIHQYQFLSVGRIIISQQNLVLSSSPPIHFRRFLQILSVMLVLAYPKTKFPVSLLQLSTLIHKSGLERQACWLNSFIFVLLDSSTVQGLKDTDFLELLLRVASDSFKGSLETPSLTAKRSCYS